MKDRRTLMLASRGASSEVLIKNDHIVFKKLGALSKNFKKYHQGEVR